MLKKIEKISILSLLTWRCNEPSLAQTTPVRTNFHGPIGVQAIEVRLYLQNICEKHYNLGTVLSTYLLSYKTGIFPLLNETNI